MEIRTQPTIRFTDLTGTPGIIFVTDGIDICRDMPAPEHHILAGVCLPHGDGPSLPQVVRIAFHYGRKHWHLMVEHSLQQRNELVAGTLPELIKQFEARFNITLPVIKVRNFGVGIYPAHTGVVAENPWRFFDGQFYSASDSYGPRTFVAVVRNGRTTIRFVRKNDELSEHFDPIQALSADNWRTLSLVEV